MSTGTRTFAIGVILAITASSGIASAQGRTSKLVEVESVRCEFPIITTGTWAKDDGTPSAETEPSELILQYDDIDTEEGSASVIGLSGRLYIITRLSGVNLHLLAIDSAGPLYITTVFDRPARPGRYKAAHSRHEFTDVSLPGFTSRPEQYVGDCEILK
jgi:hypothetical protein